MKCVALAAAALLFGLSLSLAGNRAALAQTGIDSDGTVEDRVAAARARSAALSPKDRQEVKALFSSAFQLWKSGDFKAARLGFENGLARDPANGIAHFYLAETLMRLNDRRTARSHYEMAAALVPTSQEGLKAQSALAGLPAFKPRVSGVAPEFSPEVPKAVQEALLNSPIFNSLPDSQPISCELETKYEIQGKPYRSVIRTAFQAGRASIMSNETNIERSNEVSSKSVGQSTLAGMLPLLSSSDNFKSVTVVIQRIEGDFFPLKSGNRFRFDYRTEYRSAGDDKPGYINESRSCEVKNAVGAEQIPNAIRGDENFIVECESTGVYESIKGAKPTQNRRYSICSSTLGLCAYGWPGDAGSSIPNFEGGFRFTLRGTPTEWRQSCSR